MAENRPRTSISEEKLESFDYLRFTWTDMHGISRTKLVPRRNAAHLWEHGAQVFGGSPGFGTRSEVPDHRELLEINYGNMLICPDESTFHQLPWAGGEDIRISEVLCDSYWIHSRERHGADTRYIAKKMLDRLEAEFGYRCFMGWELEFFLVHSNTQKLVFQGFDIYATYLLAKFEEFLCKMDKALTASGLNVEYMITEYASGQFEMPTVPLYGIEGVDKVFLLKEGVKEYSRLNGYEAVFMTKPFLNECANGLHFNHSLWDKKGNNVFYDPDAPDKMSDSFRYWIGGIFKHFKSLMALCCPTVNCYRRLFQPWAPVTENWGMDDRMASIRVKNYSEKLTYLENRLPTGSANPYLVVAATLAAGMDGLRHKIEPPMANDPAAPRCMDNLEEALNHLETDEVMEEALGEMMIRWFLFEKRSVEIAKVKARDLEDEKFAVEKQLYYKYL